MVNQHKPSFEHLIYYCMVTRGRFLSTSLLIELHNICQFLHILRTYIPNNIHRFVYEHFVHNLDNISLNFDLNDTFYQPTTVISPTHVYLAIVDQWELTPMLKELENGQRE